MNSITKRCTVIGFFVSGLVLLALLTVWIGSTFSAKTGVQPPWLRYSLGPILAPLGAFLIGWSILVQFKIGKGTPAPMLPTRLLVSKGPYAWARNPMTLGALLFFLGIGALMGAVVVIFLTLLVFGFLFTYIYIYETRELTKRFGAEYLEYKQRTPFFFPFISRRK